MHEHQGVAGDLREAVKARFRRTRNKTAWSLEFAIMGTAPEMCTCTSNEEFHAALSNSRY